MIGVIVQARMSSRRCPGKVLARVNGKPLLGYLLDRLERCATIERIVVATSRDASDDPIAAFCGTRGSAIHRGPLEDVAGRFVEVLDVYGFEGFVRVSGDSPLLDSRIVDQAVGTFRAGRYDLVTNVQERTFPRGQSVEIVRSTTFRDAYARMSDPSDREHVTPYFYRHAASMAIHNIRREPPCGDVQLAVDSPEDLERFERLVERMTRPHWTYGLDALLALVELLDDQAVSA